MHSPAIEKLIKLFSKFPTVGPRTASRFVFYLLRMPKEEADDLLFAIAILKNSVKVCNLCLNPFEGEGELCEICSNPGRDKSLICVVEKETDLDSIEKTKRYKGLYFILGGTLSSLKKDDIKKIKTEELFERIKDPQVKEVIIATNSTSEGEATALYLERLLKPFDTAQGKKITRLGRGLPKGSELEYADDETLSSALEGRK